MTYKIFLDDERDCPEGYELCRDIRQFMIMIDDKGIPNHISFDYYLNKSGWPDMTGLHVLQDFLFFIGYDDQKLPDDFSYEVHSSSEEGGNSIRKMLDHYLLTGEVLEKKDVMYG